MARPASDVSTDAVLFDMDGLLIDSEPLWTRAEIELAASLGGTWSTEIKAAIVGTRLDVAVPLILRWYAVPDDDAAVAAAMAFLLHRMVELYAEELPVMPGALELVDAIRDSGVPVGLVSSSYRELVDAAVATLGAQRFDLTLAGDEVAAGKPDPEPYLLACERLGARPGRVVVVEDAPSGIASAEAAGCIALAVPSVAAIASTPRRPVATSLVEVTAQWLLALPTTVPVPGTG
jgi:HAD superfamily hydrolase (TIGR01509 family)